MSPHPDWLVPDWKTPDIGGLMTTRSGGCSTAPFASMNLQHGGGDSAEAVACNRARLVAAIGAAPVFLQQVHGTRVVRVSAADARPDAAVHAADASITSERGLACVIQVADCLPVLFAAPQARAVGAAHAGWRGLAAGVLEATVAALCEAAACVPREVHAWLGASIGPARFEVGADVLEAFGVDPVDAFNVDPFEEFGADQIGAFGADPAEAFGAGPVERVVRASRQRRPAAHAATAPRFVPGQPGKWFANLPLLATDRLHAAGITSISGGTWCTASDPSRFFSFRRERVTGRMAAAVWIERRR